MAKFSVKGAGMDLLPEIQITAESQDKAEAVYRKKWENGELQPYDYDLLIVSEEE